MGPRSGSRERTPSRDHNFKIVLTPSTRRPKNKLLEACLGKAKYLVHFFPSEG